MMLTTDAIDLAQRALHLAQPLSVEEDIPPELQIELAELLRRLNVLNMNVDKLQKMRLIEARNKARRELQP